MPVGRKGKSLIKKAVGARKPSPGGATTQPVKRGGMAGMVGRAQAQVKNRTAKPQGRAAPSRAMPGRRAPAAQGKARVGMSRPGVGTPRTAKRPINQGGSGRAKPARPARPAARRARPATRRPAGRSPGRRTR